MAPRKRASSGGKKSGQQSRELPPPSQPSIFGIQHFFERHSQSQKTAPQKSLKRVDDHRRGPKPIGNRNTGNELDCAGVGVENPGVMTNSEKIASMGNYLRGENPTNIAVHSARFAVSGVCQIAELRNGAQVSLIDGSSGSDHAEIRISNSAVNTAKENILPTAGEGDQLEVSPEVSKYNSIKRFKFSPGMLIKQSQDDAFDEVTWKISPVNEKLQSMSKHLQGTDCTRINSMNLQKCSQKGQISSGMSIKLEKWLSSSPPPKADKRSLISSDRIASLRANAAHDLNCPGKGKSVNNNIKPDVMNTQSPFRTPPSLSCCRNKSLDDVEINGVSDQLGSRQHKKALIELLDQVEDAISIDHLISKDNEKLVDAEKPPQADLSLNCLTNNSEENKCNRDSNFDFLVLEVYEMHGHSESSGIRSSFKVLHLVNDRSGAERFVHLWDEWYFCVVAPGDTVHVIGEFDARGKCDVNHEKNFLIVHPDILVSGTRVSGSFSCPRRIVLDERLKHSEHSAAALMGTLLHQIFQAGLICDFPTEAFLEEYARTVLQKNLESLYACGVSDSDAWKTLIEAIPKILNWISSFLDSQGSKSSSIDFRCDEGLKKIKVSEVIDIEEMAWAPRYGLKGMIDASVRVSASSNSGEVSDTIMPLEFKTGKGTGQAAMEHSAQVMLYTLLMSERYAKDIKQGLLYYLQLDQTQGISARRSDLTGLLIRRNELAADLLQALMIQQLPPMLQSPNMCRSCRHLNACTIYHKGSGGGAEGSGLDDMYDALVSHLTPMHTDFLQTWERLVDLEAKHMEVGKKDSWSENSKNDHQPSLILDPSDKSSPKTFSRGSRFVYRFVHRGTEEMNGDSPSSSSSLAQYFRNGDYVILSIGPGCLRVANGVIVDVGDTHVSLSLAKRLRIPGQNPGSTAGNIYQQSWQIDKDESIASFAIMRYNLIQMFLPNENSSHLRKIVVDLEVPTFDRGCISSQDPAISYVWSEKSLNDDQRTAILKILTAKDYTLILGMPGTGKTTTLVHAVKALLMRGMSILLTSYTNSAIDNLLIKLKYQAIDFIRIGRNEVVHQDIQENCSSAMELKSTKEIKEKLDRVNVVAITCLGVTSPLLNNKRFDICIMDEAGQITLPVSLGPLMFASRFVLVGDHYQLPPLVQSPEAREDGMSVSLFSRLSKAHPRSIAALHYQYRMCASIMELSNALIYDNRLRCGSVEVENAKLEYRCSVSLPAWLMQVMNPNQPVIFINTDLLPAYETNDRKALNNPIEAYIIAEVAKALVLRGIEGKDIGIITPYNSQANLIRGAVCEPVEAHTIDKYQGRDKDCILVSFVRSCENPGSNTATSSSLLGDWHRINVALTRAKKKLIMVGSCGTLSRVPLLKLLMDKVEEDLSGMLFLSPKDIDIDQNRFHLRKCSHLLP